RRSSSRRTARKCASSSSAIATSALATGSEHASGATAGQRVASESAFDAAFISQCAWSTSTLAISAAAAFAHRASVATVRQSTRAMIRLQRLGRRRAREAARLEEVGDAHDDARPAWRLEGALDARLDAELGREEAEAAGERREPPALVVHEAAADR